MCLTLMYLVQGAWETHLFILMKEVVCPLCVQGVYVAAAPSQVTDMGLPTAVILP